MAKLVAETERLRLRLWTEQDRVDFVRKLNTPAVMRWLGGVQPDEAYRAGFERIEAYQRESGHTFWVVERKSDEELLGFCGLKRVNSQGAGEITGDMEVGWRLCEDAWGQGFAKEAAIASLDLAFGRFAAPHVVALTVGGNEESQGLMRRLGFTRREDLDFHTRDAWAAKLNPVIVYLMEARDWPAARERAAEPRQARSAA